LPKESVLSFSATPNHPDALPVQSASPRFRTLLREILETILLTVVIYAAVNFGTGRFRVESISMEPNLEPGQYVLVDKVSYLFIPPQRGDVVVFQYPLATEKDYIKRIIGLPGEVVTIANGVVSVNGQPLEEPYIAAPPNYASTWTLGPDQYFVLGDNRNSSSDSHVWGPLEREYLIGKTLLIYWPPPVWGLLPHYTYAAAP
jgi:signal peptidase I